jgi:oxygen-dependent protoporphyrinogen oxidase
VVNPSPKSIAVLGAGITGLTAALRLTQRGHHVRVFEASGRVGGAIRTDIEGEWLIEAGPNSLLVNDPSLLALIDELGLTPELLSASPSARNRYIVRDGTPIAAPLSPPALIRSQLFSGGAKVRIISELLRRRRTRESDVSLEEFVREHFGQEVVDYGLNPFVSGVYAGDPRHLSARHAFPKLLESEQKHGSLLRAQIAAAKSSSGKSTPGIVSFRRGLQTLPHTIAARLPTETLRLNAPVRKLTRESGGSWVIQFDDLNSTASHSEVFDAVVAALPGPALAQLRLGAEDSAALASLDAIEHPPVSSLFLGFRREDVHHPLDGFGMLVPEVERRTVLGVLFSSTLFPQRAPNAHVALTVLVGGTRNPDLARLPTDALVAAVEPDLRELLGVRAPAVFQRHTFWPRAIPQYNLGYECHLATIADVERANPGLLIGGQIRDGISLPACIASGEKMAAALS